jgi:hypothetical protein
MLEGGEYLFNQSTIANYPNGTRIFGALVLANHVQFETSRLIPLKAEFNNCIIYGSFQQEIKTYSLNERNGDATNDFNYKFRSCLIRYQSNHLTPSPEFNLHSDAFQNAIWNEDPRFLSVDNDSYNFHIGVSSAAIEKGDPEIITSYPECATDKDGIVRPSYKNPDIGAYEYVLLE